MTNEQAIGTLATYISLLGFDGSDVQEVVDQFATESQKEMVANNSRQRAEPLTDKQQPQTTITEQRTVVTHSPGG